MIGIVFGLGFALSFGYWTTNFAEVQRAMSAKDMTAARMTPIIGAFPKVFIPLITVMPGMAAIVLIPGLGQEGRADLQQRDPALMEKYLPPRRARGRRHRSGRRVHGRHGGQRASFNAVFTYDIWQDYIRPAGRTATT